MRCRSVVRRRSRSVPLTHPTGEEHGGVLVLFLAAASAQKRDWLALSVTGTAASRPSRSRTTFDVMMTLAGRTAALPRQAARPQWLGGGGDLSARLDALQVRNRPPQRLGPKNPAQTKREVLSTHPEDLAGGMPLPVRGSVARGGGGGGSRARRPGDGDAANAQPRRGAADAHK